MSKPEKPPQKIVKKKNNEKWFWVKHDILGWAPAQEVGENEYLYEDGYTNHHTKRNEVVYPLNREHLGHLEDDIVMLDDINEGFILYNIRERYAHNSIYSWVGANKSVLISINPFKKLPIYSPDTISIHSHPDVHKTLPPHVYDIAHHAYEDLLLNNTNQSILISGESGSGKTECTKQCLQFLAEVAGSEDGVEQKILEANPILEAFGNAKTVRNDNSSRFGKWSETHFDKNGKICGSYIINYLLEKSRVVIQQKGERNYHIFYQFLSKEENRKKYNLGYASSYNYTKVCTKVDSIDDESDYDAVMKAMKTLGFVDGEIDWIKDMIVAVLLLGNIEFDRGEENGLDISIIKNKGLIKQISTLLCIDSNDLEKWLTHKEFRPPNCEPIIQHTNPKEAKENTDAIAKAIYSSLFDWLVERINKSVKGKKGKYIGILDIFGFEIFDKNSFEQLCINYTNEDLQQHFNRSTFTEEEAVYKRENIPYEHIKFIDNQPILDIIDKPQGVFFYLDEMRRVPGGNDDKLLNQILNHFSNKPNIIHSSQKPHCFVINHYAGPVIYDITGFLNKNTDFLLPRLYELLSNSKSEKIASIFPIEDLEIKRKISISIQFQKQLNDLMVTLKQTYSRYIRCIKPNSEKLPDTFESVLCLEQLTYSGVFEAVKIRKLGYPFRYTHKMFVHRYKCIMINDEGKWDKFKSKRELDQVNEIISRIPQLDNGVKIGITMCLYRSEENRILESCRNDKLDKLCPIIQSWIRGRLTMKFMKILEKNNLKEVFEEAIDSLRIEDLNKAIDLYDLKVGSLSSIINTKPAFYNEAVKLKKDLQLWLNLTNKLTRLLKKDIDDNYDAIEKLVEEEEKVMKCPHSDEQEQIYKKAKKTLKEYIGHKIEPLADESIFYLDKNQMQNVLKMAENNNYNSPGIQEIRRLLSLDDLKFMELEKKKAAELKDPIRLNNRACHIEMAKLQKEKEAYDIFEYGGFRDAEDFSRCSINIFQRKHYLTTMKSFSTRGIPTSLLNYTNIETTKKAKLCFKCVRGYMGDKKYQYPEQCAYELLQFGLTDLDLRDEIYCQVIKQLTKNETYESKTKGNELLCLLIQTYLPSPELLPYIIAYLLNEHYPSNYISYIHITKYDYNGCVEQLPTLDELNNMIKIFNEKERRSRYSVDYTVEHSKGFIPQQKVINRMSVSSSRSEDEPKVKPSSKPQAKVLYKYDGGEDRTISVKKGEIVEIIKKTNEDWWKVLNDNGERGFVPRSYLKEI